MDIDLLLACLHHLAVFTLVGIVAAEFALLRPGIAGAQLSRLGMIDGAYGAVAGLVLVAGVLRVFFGASGINYYAHNWVFGLKMAAFLGVGLLSIQPTLAILRWRKTLKTNPGFVPTDAEVKRSRNFLHGEIALLVFIPLFAAAMARGYGV
ncbi:DUF2214 family protein [Devosia sp.]|uniref:DUF2214 family protein n=1 Tax=Devosia sp. TaxID=1871048 RepID=UPI0032644A91